MRGVELPEWWLSTGNHVNRVWAAVVAREGRTKQAEDLYAQDMAFALAGSPGLAPEVRLDYVSTSYNRLKDYRQLRDLTANMEREAMQRKKAELEGHLDRVRRLNAIVHEKFSLQAWLEHRELEVFDE